MPKRAEAELVEVGGQRKLLKWTVPGLAHAFVFWGFTILIFTILEAYGCLFQRNFHVPLIGHTAVLGFIEDFFALAVLVSLLVFVGIRIKNSPARENRRSRFFGSHTGAAWAVLAMIAGVMITLLLYRAAQVNTGNFPYGWWAFASHGISRALAPARDRGEQRHRDGGPARQHRHHHQLPGLHLLLEAPAHLRGPHQRGHLSAPPRPRGPGLHART